MLEGRHIGTIFLPMKLKNNNQGQGHHWSGSHKERRTASEAVSNATFGYTMSDHTKISYKLSEWLSGPNYVSGSKLGLVVWRVLGPRERLWDADSVLRGNYKQIQDALIEAGLAEDDSPKYIDWVLGRQDKERRDEGSCVEIELYDLGE